MTSTRIRATVAASSLAVAAVVTGVVLATTAQAAETDDPRAIAVDGNVSTCADAGFKGEIVNKDDLKYTGGVNNVDQSVTITGVADGLTVTGIVIKGGDAYNVYEPGEHGLSAAVPWEDLIAPTNNGGQQPQLSHWFVCAGEDDTTPPSSEPSEPPSSEPSEPPSSEPSEPPSSEPSEPPSSEPTEPSEPTSTAPVESTPAEETTTPAAVQTQDDDDLALTGFGAAWLIPIGGLLLVGGGAAMWLARNRKRA